MDHPPRISVIICTRNGERLIPDALASLRDQTLEPDHFEVLVVDNASTDATARIVTQAAAHFPVPLTLLREPVPGLSRARNRGIRAAHGNLIVFLDDDARADREWLARILDAFDDETAGAAGGPIEPWWESPPPDWWLPELDHLQSRLDLGPLRRPIRYPEGLYGSNIAVRREVFAQVGLFREQLGRQGKILISGEEVELQLRIHQAGHRIIYEPAALVRHLCSERRATLEYLRHKAYWYGKSQARCEFIAGVPPAKSLPRLPFRIGISALGLILKKSGRLNRRYHLIYNTGYLLEWTALILRPESVGPPPGLDNRDPKSAPLARPLRTE